MTQRTYRTCDGCGKTNDSDLAATRKADDWGALWVMLPFDRSSGEERPEDPEYDFCPTCWAPIYELVQGTVRPTGDGEPQ
jgi:hypothetical protein